MQYKIPIQIENEDTIVANLSLRQLSIIMIWSGIAYSLFKYAEPRVGSEVGLVIAVPFVVIGIIIALARIAEMTFLPLVLNFFRLTLNAQSRIWSQGTDGFLPEEIGTIMELNKNQNVKENQSLESVLEERSGANEQIFKL